MGTMTNEEYYRDTLIIWKCPRCDYEYEAPIDCNENLPCPEHGIPCQEAGGSYPG